MGDDKSYLKNISRDMNSICLPLPRVYLRGEHSMTRTSTIPYLKACLAAELRHCSEIISHDGNSLYL